MQHVAAERQSFNTYAEFEEWITEQMADDDCVDNYRFAFDDDAEACASYEDCRNNGCCGFFDRDIIIAGRNGSVGYNYGH